MAITKENTKLIGELHKLIKADKVNTAELQKIGIDVTVKKHTFRNVVLEKLLLGWIVELKDKKDDLDGNPINENKKLLKRLQNHWEANTSKITNKELLDDFNYYGVGGATNINIGNFNLNSTLRLNVYDITLIDSEKSINDKWVDKYVSADKVKKVLLKFEFVKALLKLSEVQLNKLLEDHFKLYFETVKKGDTTNEGLVDLNIGNGKFVIEMKLAKEAKKSDQSDRAIGQIERYNKHFGDKFLFVVFGDEKDRDEKNIQSLAKKVKSCGGIYQFITAD